MPTCNSCGASHMGGTCSCYRNESGGREECDHEWQHHSSGPYHSEEICRKCGRITCIER